HRQRRRPRGHRPPRLPGAAGRRAARRRQAVLRLRLVAHPRRGGGAGSRCPVRRPRVRTADGGPVMKALLLGGAGFIGLHLTRRLIAEGHRGTISDDFPRGRGEEDVKALSRHENVTVVTGDLTAPATWTKLPHGWDQIYLLAAVVGVRNVEQDPARVIRVNTLSALNLLDWVAEGTR